jgi:hypothetical protein
VLRLANTPGSSIVAVCFTHRLRREREFASDRLHLDISIPREAQDRYVAENAFATTTEATDNVAWALLKNRVLTSSVNTWPPSRDVC